MTVKNKISTKDLAFIAVLCSICSVCRIVFHFIPYITPFTALVIIIGSYLGPFYGFSIGTCSVFISNFFLGQGLWTPFQMLAIAIIGYFSGIFFAKTKKEKSLILLSIWSLLGTSIIYGVVLSIHQFMFMFSWDTTEAFSKFFAVFAVSFFTNGIWHAISTVLFLLFGGKSIGKILKARI
jgi:uncharacterized membrane protein